MPYVDSSGVRDFTPEEIEEMKNEQKRQEEEWPQNPPQPTIDERVTVLEQDMADIQAAYQEGVNNA